MDQYFICWNLLYDRKNRLSDYKPDDFHSPVLSQGAIYEECISRNAQRMSEDVK